MKNFILLIASGLVFASCAKEKKECPSAIEKTFNLTGFNKIIAAETFSVTVTNGTTYSVKAKGCPDDLSDLSLQVTNGGFLDIQYNHYKSSRYKVAFEITVPVLTSFNLGGAATGKITGFGGQTTHLRTILSGTAQCTINGLPLKIEIDNSGTSILNLWGNADELSATLSGGTKLNSYTAIATYSDVYTSGTAKAYIMAGQNLVASANGASRIYYKGAPSMTQVEETGTGKVIHE